MSKSSLVRLEQQGAVAHIVLARAQAHNAINLALCEALQRATAACATDPSIRAVVLRSEGPDFCVGGDLAEFGAYGQGRPELVGALAAAFHAAERTLMTLRAPVVVAVQGAAAGAGLGLALCGTSLSPPRQRASPWPTPRSASRPTGDRPTSCRG